MRFFKQQQNRKICFALVPEIKIEYRSGKKSNNGIHNVERYTAQIDRGDLFFIVDTKQPAENILQSVRILEFFRAKHEFVPPVGHLAVQADKKTGEMSEERTFAHTAAGGYSFRIIKLELCTHFIKIIEHGGVYGDHRL